VEGRLDLGAAAARTEELYRDHGRLVGGLCRALLRDAAEGEDATQQVFLAAHKALLNGTSPREPAAWLATIARNECWARIRGRMREPLPAAEVDGVTSLSDPLAEAVRNANLAAMWRAIADLPRQQREALLLREFGGLSYEELAGALAVSGSAVESLLFRARQGVRARIETAYAGLAGAGWLESLGRLAGGIGGGMAPVAAKVAAVGVGAAIATGGAVVAPPLFHHWSRVHLAPRPAKAIVGPVAPRHEAAPSPPVFFVARLTQPVPAAARPAGEERRHGGSAGEDRTRGDGGSASSGEDGAGGQVSGTDGTGEARNAVESGTRGSRHEDSSQEHGDGNASSSGGDGSPSGSSHGGDGSSSGGDGSSSGGHDSSSGGDGSGHDGGSSDDGGDVTTTSNQVVTVTVSAGDNTPVPGVPDPGDGG
jgi:RNA polymerase sigma factor (sigma-70 family)